MAPFPASFSLSFSTPFWDPLQISFFAKPTHPQGTKGPLARKSDSKVEPKWVPKVPVPLHFCTPGAAWCPRGLLKHPRPHFHRFGVPFCPPKLHLYLSLTLSFARQGPKHRQEQPRTAKKLPRTCRNTKHTTTHRTKFC